MTRNDEEKWETWEIKRIKKDMDTLFEDKRDMGRKIDDLESFRDSTVEKMTVIFSKIEELAESGKWLKRTLFGALASGVVTVLTTLIIWAFKN